jgi:uncharacterized membrane protein YjjP (DUF1212 family)
MHSDATRRRPGSAAHVATGLQMAAMVIENGGTSASAERAFNFVLRALGDDRCDVRVRIDSILASRSGSVVGVKTLAAIGTNLARAEQVHQLARNAAELSPGDLQVELGRVGSTTEPYRALLVHPAVGLGSVTFALLAGGDWGAAGIACTAGMFGRSIRDRLLEHGVSISMITLLVALIATLTSAAALRLGLSSTHGPALLASVMHLVPGVMLINGVWDIAAGRYVVMGLQRLTFAGMLFLALGLALAVGAFAARV